MGKDPRPTPRRPRWLLIFLFLVFATVVASILFANPPFPDSAELNDVRVEPPPRRPPSTALKALLASSRHAALPPPVEQAWKRIAEGTWPERPEELARALDELRPPLEETRAALLAPGCHPEEELKPGEVKPSSEVSYVNLLRGAKLIALRATARALLEGPIVPASELAALQRRLVVLEGGCSASLIAALVLHSAIGTVERALALLLAHPALSEESARLVWERLLAGESRPSPMPDAIRWEVRFQRGLVDAIEREGERRETDLPMAWPWYSRASTLEIIDQLGRRAIWLSERRLSETEAWGKRFPEEEYFDRLARQPRPLVIFRHNAIGKTLLAIAPDLRRYVLKWHQGRCLDAARRARLVRELLARGRPVPTEARRPASDPRTGVPFTGTEQGLLCGLPNAYARGNRELTEGVRTTPLAPEPAPASAPARR